MRKGSILAAVLVAAAPLGACRAPASAHYARVQPGRIEAERLRALDPLADRHQAPEERAPSRADRRTVEEAIAEALARNPALDAAIQRWTEAAARVDVVTEYPDPVLNLAWMPEPIETRLGPTRGRMGVMQRVPWPGKLDARGCMQAAKAEVARLELRRLAWRIATDVRVAYADLVETERDVEILEAERELVRSWNEIVQSRLELAQARTSDALQLDLRLQRLEELRLAALERRRAVLARLNALRSRPPGEPLAPVGPEDPASEPTIAALLDLARAWNPDLERAAAMRRAAEAGIRVADLERFPDPTFGVEYTVIGEGPMASSDNGDDAIGLSLSVPLPLRTRGREAERLAARMAASAAFHDERGAHDRVCGEVGEALHGLHEARQRITIYEERLLPLVERQIEVGLEEYASARGTMIELLSYEEARLSIHQDVVRAQARAWRARARLDHAVGVRVGPAPSPGESAATEETDAEAKEEAAAGAGEEEIDPPTREPRGR